MKKALSVLTAGILSLTLSSCGYKYQTKRIEIREGTEFATSHNGTFGVDQVTEENIIISAVGVDPRQSWTLDISGREHMNGSHSLGNNESLKILSTNHKEGTADIELTWLESVGALTHPPF